MWIAIDLDHTLSKNEDIAPGERYCNPYPGAKEALLALQMEGYKIMIHSCNRVKWAEEWLNHWHIPYDEVWEGVGKPVASLYVDDRGYHFQGDWKMDVKAIRTRLENG